MWLMAFPPAKTLHQSGQGGDHEADARAFYSSAPGCFQSLVLNAAERCNFSGYEGNKETPGFGQMVKYLIT